MGVKFEEACIKNLLETILVIKQGIEIIDEDKKARAGALLGSQAMALTQFLQKNRKNPLVKKCVKEMERQGKEAMKKSVKKFANQFQKTIDELRARERKRKEEEGDLRYVG